MDAVDWEQIPGRPGYRPAAARAAAGGLVAPALPEPQFPR